MLSRNRLTDLLLGDHLVIAPHIEQVITLSNGLIDCQKEMPGHTRLIQYIIDRAGVPHRMLQADLCFSSDGIDGQEAEAFDPAKLKRI